MEPEHIVFVQKRADKAGAQQSLALICKHIQGKTLSVVLGERDWLDRKLVDHVSQLEVVKFPSARSLAARLFGVAAWARKVSKRIDVSPESRCVVVSNDYHEAPMSLALAKALNAHSVLIIRNAFMGQTHFLKYGCDKFDALSVVDKGFIERVGSWGGRNVCHLPEAVEVQAFSSVTTVDKVKSLCVLGAGDPRKGWGDALQVFSEIKPQLDKLERISFIGPCDDISTWRNKATAMGLHNVSFLGGVECVAEVAREHDVAIHPSHGEAFGLALAEVLAAGVPVLSSRVGFLLDDVLDGVNCTYPLGALDEMAAKLACLLSGEGLANLYDDQKVLAGYISKHHTEVNLLAGIEAVIDRDS